MDTAKPTTIDAYIAAFPSPVQERLEQVRRAVRAAVPGAEEMISYQMPAFKYRGRQLLYFGGWKAHIALYPASGSAVDAFADELASYEVSKGTIKFPHDRRLPVALIRRIAKFRAKENIERERAKNRTRTTTRMTKPAGRG